MNTAVKGLVIWEVKTGEADRVITLLTAFGTLTAYARGSLKPTGKLTAPTAMLCCSDFVLAPGKSMYTVTEASAESDCYMLKNDPEKYALSIYFCELLKLLVQEEDDGAEAYLKLMQNCLYLLDNDMKPLWQVKAVFELTAMTLAGYMPELYGCADCGKSTDTYVSFNPLEATWRCADCSGKRGCSIDVPFGVIEAMRYVTTSEPKRAFAFDLEKQAAAEFSRCCELLVLNQLDYKLPRLDFYHRLTDYRL